MQGLADVFALERAVKRDRPMRRGARLRFGTRIRAGRWVLDLAGGGRGTWPGRALGAAWQVRADDHRVIHSRGPCIAVAGDGVGAAQARAVGYRRAAIPGS